MSLVVRNWFPSWSYVTEREMERETERRRDGYTS